MQIDKFKFGKQKYLRGHTVEGVCILGGIEETEEKQDFLFDLPDRNAQILTAIIHKHFLADLSLLLIAGEDIINYMKTMVISV